VLLNTVPALPVHSKHSKLMATNLIGNAPNVAIAKQTVSFASMGLSSENIAIIYEVRNPIYSWRPERQINAITGMVAGRGYWIVPKSDLDLTTYFAPPLPSGGGGNCGPTVNAGADQDLPSNTAQTTLIGTATASNGETVAATRWVLLEFPSIYPAPVFVDPSALNTVVTGLKAGTYVFQLQATSNTGATSVDSVLVLVAEPDEIIVDAGSNQELDEGTTTTNVYGSATTSGEVEIVGYQWSVVSSPSSNIVFSDPTGPDSGVTGLAAPGVNILRLTATDQLGRAFHDDVQVEVLTPSQMFKTTGWDTDRPAQQMWVYLPQGYKPERALGYPFILFLHGMGENGDETFEGVPNNDNADVLLRESAGLPYFIYNKLYPMKSVVLMPQLHTGLWGVTDAQKALNYALANYNLDLTTVGVTGLSSGGKGAFDICLANPSLFSASMPCNPVYSDVGAGGGATVKDIAFMIITSYGDETGAPPNADGGAFDAVDSICAANPKGLYPPRVICGWDYGHVPETWNWLAYDKRRAVFDFEKDFFLLHSKTYSTTCTNYVVKAETTKTFYDWSLAMVQLDRLQSGTIKTQLQGRMATLLNQITTERGHKYFMLDYGSSADQTNPYYPVTRAINSSTGPGGQSALFIDINGVTSTYRSRNVSVVSNNSTGISHNEMGVSSGVFSSYASPDVNQRIFGLDPNKVYDFYAYFSNRSDQLKSTNNRTGAEASFNGRWAQLLFEGWNTMFTANAYGVTPTPDVTDIGYIDVNTNRMFGASSVGGNLTALLIREREAPDNRESMGKFNFAANSNGVDSSEYATISADPTQGTSFAVDPVSGWRLETIGTAPPYWKKYFDQYWADNNVYNVDIPTPMVGLPQVVARSGWFNDNQYFDDVTQNYNLQCVGIPGMGFRAGLYHVKIYGATTNAEGSTGEYVCKFTEGGIQKLRLNSLNNSTGKYVSFTGRMKEGDFIKMGVFMPNIYGQTFINYIEIERIED
jgi:poly(3-hydroxybutyrate) depolymerase